MCACGEISDDCSKALEIVCSCESVDCSDGTSSETVLQLRKCERTDEFPEDDSLPVCILDSDRYCAIADGLAAQDAELCDVPCSARDACDLTSACNEYQYEQCDVGESQ
jgi:hypothetical protein